MLLLQVTLKKLSHKEWIMKGVKTMKFYWFEFADGYRCCVAGMSNRELRIEESKHGKLVSKVVA